MMRKSGMSHFVKPVVAVLSVAAAVFLVYNCIWLPSRGEVLWEMRDAVVQGNLDRVKELVQERPWLVDAPCPFRGSKPGSTPLHTVVLFDDDNHLRVAAFLTGNGADLNARNTPLGETALHAAALAGSARMVELLLKEGADPNARDKAGQTALYLAYRDKSVAELLIRQGADVNTCDNDLQTPLHRAAYAGEAAVVAVLLASGADPNAKNRSGQTALQLAISRGRQEAAELLEKKGRPE